MDMHALRRSLPALVGLIALTICGWAAAEPPSRVARLGYISGTVSFSPAGEPDWVQAMVNRPLTTGDRLWSDTNSRAELQIGGAALRLGATTSVTVLNLDDRITQLQLSQGTLKVRVRHMWPNQTFEIDTPNLAFTLRRPGEYRIDVDPNDDATAVMVQSGEGEVYGDGASYAVNSHQGYRFYGTDLSDYDRLGSRREDDLDRWARERDRRGDNSPSARYVSSEVVGYEDLDANGTWRSDPDYGNVWTPTHVAADWTPYRDGHWAWVDPWGWTWVDDAPWGFAVSHYGRWTNISGSWGWVPGPQREQAVYAPALVAFIGGKNFQVSVSVGASAAPNVGWFPLAPREVYQPSYPVSSTYFANINRSNAVIAPTIITKVYNTTNITTNVTNVTYVNQHVAGAVVAVPMQAFVQSQPVAKAVVKVSNEMATSAPVAHIVAVTPLQQSMHGGAPTVAAAPPAHEHAVVARTAPPPPPVPFALQQKQLAAKPGVPIDETQRTQLKPAAPSATAPKVSVVTAVKTPTATALPPETAPAVKSPEARKIEAAKVVEAAKSGVARPEVAKVEPGKPDAAKAATAKADAAKAATAKAEAEAAKVDSAKAAKAEATNAEAAKVDAAKADAARAASAKSDAATAAATRAEASKADAAKAEAVKAEAAKVEAARADTARAEAAKAKAEQAKADTTRAANAKAEESRNNAAKADQAKAEQARAEAAKADAARAANAKAEESRNNAAKAEQAKAEQARAEQARAEAAKADAARAANAKAEESRNNAAKAEQAKAAQARAEAARANVARSAPPQAAPGASRPAVNAPGRKVEHDAKSEEEQKKKKAEQDTQNR